MIDNNENNAINIIKITTRNLIPDCKILLFGSRARLNNTEDSDYDFLIITNNTIDIIKKREYKAK